MDFVASFAWDAEPSAIAINYSLKYYYLQAYN